MSRPVIGIVANYAAPAGGIAYAKLNAGYYRSVERAGGLPLILPPTDGPAVIEQYLDAVDGVLFGGGRDLDPRRYGQAKHPATKLLAEPLERYLLAMFDRVLRRPGPPSLPVLAICLGCQALNVVRGGTLHQHLPDLALPVAVAHRNADAASPGDRVFHPVTVEPGSLLASVAARETLEVNSAHHQGLDRLGERLVVSARSPDGLIEAVEDPTWPFLLAVQWHPEEITDRPEQLALFQGFVRSAGRATRVRAVSTAR